MSFVNPDSLKQFLDDKYQKYNQIGFIKDDPISIPHFFKSKQDIEIMGFWAAILAWGQRRTIISKATELVQLMGGEPYKFIVDCTENDLRTFLTFRHRTFNDIDTLYFLAFFKRFYSEHSSLEEAFLLPEVESLDHVGPLLTHFHRLFFSLPDAPHRTKKHVPSPANHSACKRLNMFLRWMVRKDDGGVDFGIWERIKPSQLICPCDLHVDRVARQLGLIKRQKTDWQAAVELTENLKFFDPKDPVKYDYALFGIGIEEKGISLPMKLVT